MIERFPVRDQIKGKIGIHIWGHIKSLTHYSIWYQVMSQAHSQVGDQVWDQVRDQVRVQVEEDDR